jgi:hypothetical protein
MNRFFLAAIILLMAGATSIASAAENEIPEVDGFIKSQE